MSAPFSSNPPQSTDPSGAIWRRARRLGLAVFALLLAAAGVRTYINAAQAKTVAARTQRNALRAVLVTRVRAATEARQLNLPATLRGRNEVALYARTNGYLKRWTHDIGDHVHKGDLLALIDTPEVDQDLAQALAAQEQIKARLALAQSTLTRWEGLRQRDAVSQQELDERRSALRQAQADLTASQANVGRLQQLHDFGRIVAPFDGVVVSRNVDVGALVAAGSGAATRELFYLAQTDALKLTVAVPQTYAADVAVGKAVSVKLPERPGKPEQGRISRLAGGVDIATRSLQVEITLDHPGGAFLPGAYVEVGLPLNGKSRALLVSPNTLQFRQDGARVAVVRNDKVYLRPVKLGNDLGRSVEVISGLAADERLILNPPDTLENGMAVDVHTAPEDARGEADKTGGPPALKAEGKRG